MDFDYHITMDSFGQDCPSNLEEIADYLNTVIDEKLDKYGKNAFDNTNYAGLSREGTEIVSAVWENYWNDYHSGTLNKSAPAPVIE